MLCGKRDRFAVRRETMPYGIERREIFIFLLGKNLATHYVIASCGEDSDLAGFRPKG